MPDETPLTDEELDDISMKAARFKDGPGDVVLLFARTCLDLVAEVRRLRAPVANADVERVLGIALDDMEMNEHERCVGEKEHASARAQQEDLRRVIRSAGRELDRLRSDEWLAAAARELSVAEVGGRPMGIHSHFEAALAILRKHRDGKA